MADNKSRRPDPKRQQEMAAKVLAEWQPKTELGRKVRNKEITNIDEILDKGLRVLEPEIVDTLLNLSSELILVGQSKGKFGGGQRRVFRQTQKKTMEGNYLRLVMSSKASATREMTKKLRISEDVLRHILINLVAD